MSIKSPYNFVPLNKKVYFPDWANNVSHDIPFSDQRSGEIKVRVEAHSPIFIRNGQFKNERDSSFSNYNGEYFIPATTIKGMVRSVLEIMSFGKMDQVDDRKYSWRDLSNENYSKRFTRDFHSEPKVKAGFITEDHSTGNWYLIPASMARIEQCELGDDFGVDKKLLSAVNKYKYWESMGEALERDFSIKGPDTKVFEKQCGKFKRARMDSMGSTRGTLVFTGQIKPRNKGGEGKHGKGNKHLEFVFFDEDKKNKKQISEKMRRDFILNHSKERNKDNHKQSMSANEEWGFWKNKLAAGKYMPVFWLPDDSGNVESFGLAMLYRLPFKYSVKDLLSDEHTVNKPDLAEVIFGSISKGINLKGRVQFSNAKIINQTKPQARVKVVLASPKATYYPTYIRQNNRNKYNTYDDYNAELAGRKRYPVHSHDNYISYFSEEQENMASELTPLPKGCVFEFKMRYHNIRPIELGAILSALTLHGNNKSLYHSIGMGKPLGFGKIMVSSIEGIDNIEEYMKVFEKEMNLSFVTDGFWIESEQITELFSMAEEKETDILTYMHLGDFQKIKNNKHGKREYLRKYSDLTSQYKSVSFWDRKEVEEEKIQKKEELARKENISRKIMNLKDEISKSYGLQKRVLELELSLLSNEEIKEQAIACFEEHILLNDYNRSAVVEQFWKISTTYIEEYIDTLSAIEKKYAEACLFIMKFSRCEINEEELIDKLYKLRILEEEPSERLLKIFDTFKKQLYKRSILASDNVYDRLLLKIEESPDNCKSEWSDIYTEYIASLTSDDLKNDPSKKNLIIVFEKVTRKEWQKKKSKKNKYYKKIKALLKL